MINITEWCIGANPWIAPECRGNPSLVGKANVPGLTNGETKGVVTSAIRKVEGRCITTASGSTYTLIGEPSQFFLDDLKVKGFEYNPDRPLDCYLGDYIHVEFEMPERVGGFFRYSA